MKGTSTIVILFFPLIYFQDLGVVEKIVLIKMDSSDYDILNQFSSMGTVDHEELISQFQQFVNYEANKETASTILSSSNWSEWIPPFSNN